MGTWLILLAGNLLFQAVEAMEAEVKTMEKNVPKIRTILSSMDDTNITLAEHLHNREVKQCSPTSRFIFMQIPARYSAILVKNIYLFRFRGKEYKDPGKFKSDTWETKF